MGKYIQKVKDLRKKVSGVLRKKKKVDDVFIDYFGCQNKFPDKISEGPLVMTLLVRNEERLLDYNIRFHLAQGVDFIIATDNGSTDKTHDILMKYQKQGVLHVIDEPAITYDQVNFVGRMIEIARDVYHAEWVMNVDADEFWYSDYGNIKKDLYLLREYNTVYPRMIHIIPPKPDTDCEKDFLLNTNATLDFWNARLTKCLHKTEDFLYIFAGNHDVAFLHKKPVRYDGLTIFHYPVRSFAQYKIKTRLAGEAFSNHPAPDAPHVKAFMKLYEKYLRGELFEVYSGFWKDKAFFSDSRVKDFISNNYRMVKDFYNVNPERNQMPRPAPETNATQAAATQS